MKLTSVMFEKKITKEEKDSLGQYANEVLRLEGTLGENENPDIAILGLMERVHIHLGVPFKSAVKEQLAQVMKDSVPSETPKERPAKVDEAKERIQERRASGKEEAKEGKRGPKKGNGGRPKKGENKNVEKEEKVPTEKKEPVQEEKIENGKLKSGGTPYNRELLDHKTEFGRLLDKLNPLWRKDPEVKAKCVLASKKLEGEILFTNTGRVSKAFVNNLKGLLASL